MFAAEKLRQRSNTEQLLFILLENMSTHVGRVAFCNQMIPLHRRWVERRGGGAGVWGGAAGGYDRDIREAFPK